MTGASSFRKKTNLSCDEEVLDILLGLVLGRLEVLQPGAVLGGVQEASDAGRRHQHLEQKDKTNCLDTNRLFSFSLRKYIHL